MRLCKWFFVVKSWMAVLPSAIFVRFIPQACRPASSVALLKIDGALARGQGIGVRFGGVLLGPLQLGSKYYMLYLGYN